MITISGSHAYLSDPKLAGVTIKKVRDLYGDDPSIKEGAPILAGTGKELDDNYRLKIGDRVSFKEKTLKTADLPTPAIKLPRGVKVKTPKEPFAEERELMKDEVPVASSQVKAKKAGKDLAMVKKPKKPKAPKKAKRTSKVVHYCQHGRWNGFTWCGHRRLCKLKELTPKEFKARNKNVVTLTVAPASAPVKISKDGIKESVAEAMKLLRDKMTLLMGEELRLNRQMRECNAVISGLEKQLVEVEKAIMEKVKTLDGLKAKKAALVKKTSNFEQHMVKASKI